MIKKISRLPVPDSAVWEMLDRCYEDDQEDKWILIKFSSKVSLDEARRRIGSVTYSEQDRLQGFMMKFSLIEPRRPDAAIFYSSEKGFLLAHRETIRALEEKYGRWMLDTWYCLIGSMKRLRIYAINLDGPQTLIYGQHVDASFFKE